MPTEGLCRRNREFTSEAGVLRLAQDGLDTAHVLRGFLNSDRTARNSLIFLINIMGIVMEINPLNAVRPPVSGQTHAPLPVQERPTFSRTANTSPTPASKDMARPGRPAHLAPGHIASAQVPANAQENIHLNQLRNMGNELMQMQEGEEIKFLTPQSQVLCSVVKSEPGVVTVHHGDTANKMRFIKTPDGQVHVHWSNDKGQLIKGSHLRGADSIAARNLGRAACDVVRKQWGY